jgi:adenylosuccinate lyase
MIERYQVADITRIWSEENKYRTWLQVELAICDAWTELGEIPPARLKAIRKKAAFDVSRIGEIEKRVKHDVIAFLTSVEEFVGADSAYIHKGITSYDVVDTALSLLLGQSLDLVLTRCQRLHQLLLEKAFAYRNLLSIGRTHGIHAEPVSFGQKYLVWYEEMGRNLLRLDAARRVTSVGKISGAVGTYSHFPPEGEAIALKRLGLEPCRATTQVIQRDRHAEMVCTLAILGSSLEKMALDIRHLQRTEVLEAEEPFSEGQKGSSAMPHKRNPVRCERISGMARLLRGQVGVALENNVLWHERDISHSSAERVLLPDIFHLASFMLDDLTSVLADLVVYPENIRRNLQLTNGIYFSQKLLTLLVQKGVARQRAYELVQKQALRAWLEKASFRELVQVDEEITRFCTPAELLRTFSDEELQAQIGKIFERFRRDRPHRQPSKRRSPS